MKEGSDIPVVGVVEAGILATANKLKDKNSTIMILGTKATISSKAYEYGLKKLGYFNLLPKATPLFVPLVEEGIYEGEILEASFRYYFNGIDKVDAIILGCTHFPLIQKKICEFFPIKPVMIHSGEAIVEYLENNFDFTKTYKETNLKFFASENPTSLKEVAKKWLQLN
jgi:glutamate racemase